MRMVADLYDEEDIRSLECYSSEEGEDDGKTRQEEHFQVQISL